MQFKDWVTKLEREQKKLSEGTLSNVTETICLAHEVITLSLSADRLRAEIGGRAYPLKNLRVYYTQNKEEFWSLLSVIKDKVKKTTEATDALLDIMTDTMTPELVLARMSGESVGDSSKQILESKASKFLKEMGELIDSKIGSTEFNAFDFDLGLIKGTEVSIGVAGSRARFIFGGSSNSHGSVTLSSHLDEILNLVLYADLIRSKVTVFMDKLVEATEAGKINL